MIAASIQRDVFARQTLRRVSLSNRPGRDHLAWCSWCGNCPPTLYRYRWQADDSTSAPQFDTRRQFCNLACATAHNG